MDNEKIRISLKSTPKALPLEVPANIALTVADPPAIKVEGTAIEKIREALDNPIGSPKVENIVKPGNKVCIIADDLTRPTPVALVLQELLPRLLDAGIQKKDIVIVMALGSHRPMTETEMAERVGEEVYKEYRVLNSEFKDPAMLTQVGNSQLGTPIRVFKPAMEADIRIAIGNIVPHGTMGWSGGAKILYPGITSEDIVSEFHLMQGFQREITYGRDESEIRLAVEKWTENIGLHFIINTVLTGEFEVYKVVAGHYVKAHRVGVKYSRRCFGVALDSRPNVVVSSSFPMDIDFWQCIKGVWSAGSVIAEGGTMIVVGPCLEGVGSHKDFPAHIGLKNGEAILRESMLNGNADLVSMSIGVSVGKLRSHCQIHWVTDGMSKEEIEKAGFIWHPTSELQKLLDESIEKYANPKVLIIPVGSETLAYIKEKDL